jgi:hypothetical protein
MIGRVSEDQIQTFKRTNIFTKSDFHLLLRIIDKFDKLIITPNILTEVSNLSNGLSGKSLEKFHDSISSSLETIKEVYITSAAITEVNGFSKYGLADSGIIAAAKDNYLVLSDDLKFTGFAAQRGIDCINFNHVRDAEWGNNPQSRI